MIGCRTPLRLSFVGGGSDLRAFYATTPGCVVSTSINKYIYTFVHPLFFDKIQVRCSHTEVVDRIQDIQHPILREVLKQFGGTGLDINALGDVPGGTGLGSSSAFTVGLFHALSAFYSRTVTKEDLARAACDLEINVLKEPIGKQDQYAAAYGGLNYLEFHPDEHVQVEPITLPPLKQRALEENLLLFYLGSTRATRTILHDQQANLLTDHQKHANVRHMTELAQILKRELMAGNIDTMGHILDENWRLKKTLSHKISTEKIDHYYALAHTHGALGGKLCGAGGGGFLLVYCPLEHQEKLRSAFHELKELRFTFDHAGTQLLTIDSAPPKC